MFKVFVKEKRNSDGIWEPLTDIEYETKEEAAEELEAEFTLRGEKYVDGRVMEV